jgi:hypothetical protein
MQCKQLDSPFSHTAAEVIMKYMKEHVIVSEKLAEAHLPNGLLEKGKELWRKQIFN